jgi:uncharacterized protein
MHQLTLSAKAALDQIETCLTRAGLGLGSLDQVRSNSRKYRRALLVSDRLTPQTITTVAQAVYAVGHPETGYSQDLVRRGPDFWQRYCAALGLNPDISVSEFGDHFVALFSPTDVPGPDRYQPFSDRSGIRDPRGFHGRVWELASLQSRVETLQSCQLMGPKKTGKTSLLLAVGRSLDSWVLHGLFVYVDMGLPLNQTMAGFLAGVARACDWSVTPTTLVEFEACLRAKQDRPIVLAIDSCDVFTRLTEAFPIEFFQALRAMAQDEQVRRHGFSLLCASRAGLRAIIASNPNLSPLTGILALISVGDFTAAEADGFPVSQEPAASFDLATRRAILAWAGAHPCKLQLACYHHLQNLAHPSADGIARAMGAAQAEWAQYESKPISP